MIPLRTTYTQNLESKNYFIKSKITCSGDNTHNCEAHLTVKQIKDWLVPGLIWYIGLSLTHSQVSILVGFTEQVRCK